MLKRCHLPNVPEKLNTNTDNGTRPQGLRPQNPIPSRMLKVQRAPDVKSPAIQFTYRIRAPNLA